MPKQKKTWKRGRRPGIGNGEGKPKVPIKKWSSKHEMIVYMRVVGMLGVEEIAKRLKLTTTWVAQVLRDPQAVELERQLRLGIRKNIQENAEIKVAQLGIEALERLAHTIERKDLDLVLNTEEKKHQDRLSLDFIKETGLIADVDRPERGRENKNLTESLAARLINALEKSNEAEEIRRQNQEERIQEAEFVVEEGK